jgi:formylglycine-generating enzyme required for sulfatase activity
VSFLRGIFGPPDVEKLREQGNVNELIKALDYRRDTSVPKAAARVLGEIGETQAIEPLIATLKNKDIQIRISVVEALGQFNERRAIEALVVSLQDEALQETVENILENKLKKQPGDFHEDTTGDRRHITVNALGHKGGKKAVKLLLLALEGEGDIVPQAAMAHLAKIGDMRAYDSFVALLQDKDWSNRKEAASALGNIGDERAIDPLIWVLKSDRDYNVRKAASEALDSLGWQPANETDRVYQTITQFPKDDKQWEDVARNSGTAAFEPFAFALKDENYLIRHAAIRALGQIEDDRVVGLMIEALKDDDGLVRMIAAQELGRIGDKRAAEPLLDALFAPFNVTTSSSSPHSYDSIVRSSFVDALGKIGDVQAVEPFLAIFGDVRINTALRIHVAKALGDIGDERAIEPLTRALATHEQMLKSTAERSLEKIKKRLEGAKRAAQEQLLAPLSEKPKKVKDLPSIVHGPQGQEFILIPAGTFLMGSTEEELKQLATQWGDPEIIQKAHLDLEMPQHEVNLAAYYIGKQPVTNADWQAFKDAGGYENETYWSNPEVLHNLRKKTPWYWPDPKWSQPNHPVVGIGWDDCVAYCKWLSGVMGRTVRLLTEAEWEKAAGWDEKRKEKRRFPWGDKWDSSRCNSLDSGNLRTTPVGQYSPLGDSPYGIADMVGNVSEYCSTLFSDAGLSHYKEYPYPYQQDDGREDITSTLGGYFGGSHIQRGGNWDMQWLGCRCSFRQTVKRGIVSTGIGVRVGFSVEP